MEKDFQTSFIPKKPVISERIVSSRPIGFFTVIAIFVLVTVIIASGVLYFYDSTESKNIAQMENDLELAQNRFEPSKIVELQTLDNRLKAATTILNNHIAVSPIFGALEALTMKTVSYTKFNFSAGDGTASSPLDIKISGQAAGYRDIALQADLFATNKSLLNPVFSNLTLNTNGSVAFDLEFSVDPSFINYKQMLLTEAQ